MDRPTLAVVKLTSCDGCQLTLLDCERDLLNIARVVNIASFPEVSSRIVPGPYDITLVEGSITSSHQQDLIQRVRQSTTTLVAIGACAVNGGIQALRQLAGGRDLVAEVYPHPELVDALPASTPIADHVDVDIELPGCPIDKGTLLATIGALLHGARPPTHGFPVCMECKRGGTPCLVVTDNEACMGPITAAGCGALCPSLGRGCFGCFGPSPRAAVEAWIADMRRRGTDHKTIERLLGGITSAARPFAAALASLEEKI